MALEKRFFSVAPQQLMADGTDRGLATMVDTSLFKVKQRVTISAVSMPNLELEIKRILSRTKMLVGPISSDIKLYYDISEYTVGKSAFIIANEQNRPNIPFEEVMRAVYDEEPTVAFRSVLVDKMGQKYDVDHPLPVQLSDGQVNIGTVNAEIEVQISHKDNWPDIGDVHDSTRIGDGTYEVTMTPSEDLERVGINTINLAKPFTRPYDKVTITAKNDDGDIIEIVTKYKGISVQRATLIYDSDGDFQDIEVEDL